MTEKEQLYYLLEHVSAGDYDINTFCDLFTTIFNIDIDKTTLTELELSVFSKLEGYTCRYTSNDEDLRIPNAYFDEERIKEQVEIAIKKLI